MLPYWGSKDPLLHWHLKDMRFHKNFFWQLNLKYINRVPFACPRFCGSDFTHLFPIPVESEESRILLLWTIGNSYTSVSSELVSVSHCLMKPVKEKRDRETWSHAVPAYGYPVFNWLRALIKEALCLEQMHKGCLMLVEIYHALPYLQSYNLAFSVKCHREDMWKTGTLRR